MSKTRQTLLTVLAAGVLLLGADIYQSTSGELPVANAESVRTTRKTKVMARPGETGRVLTRVDSGTRLTVLARKGRWIKVRANGRTGWITRTSAAATRSARKNVRRTRRRPFVEGRSTRRGFSGSGPADRVGADATDDEEEIIEDEVEEERARPKRRAKKSSKRSRRTASRDEDMDDMDDMGDMDEDFEDEEEAPAPSPKMVQVSVEETELLTKPSGKAKNVAWVEKGQKLVVLESDGEWMLVESPDGDEGWIRSDDVKSAGYTYPKMLKRGGASLGYTSMGSLFASDGQGDLANYKITTAAASLAVGGDVLYRYSDKYILGVDARYIGTRASPGIRYVDADGNAADIGFLQHEIMVKGLAGYNMRNASGTVIYRSEDLSEAPTQQEIYPGVRFTQNIRDLEHLAETPPSDVRLFLGHAGWGEGQLLEEFLRNDWITAPVTDELVFGTDAKETWRQALLSVGVDPALLPSWTPGDSTVPAN